ncbi:HdeD family acid-resistance protein [Pseudosporangium ferrugineum]|uniref:Uncharacterized membrane protein HdeD (DUF308 family) n=1 Tax=Pseudosporangium ferrugineum TaxID=439699 RepID=A0A2T0SBM3_9ACTN|nr:DUF308 domain-containing protein [Pseudosporangium ferrugineum]PRY30829.1 uncharacterized membrane protein HdeD (DUF308 family) [Pseudosporangium ferrugineum]
MIGTGNNTAAARPGVAAELRSIAVPWKAVLATGVLGVAFGAAVLLLPDVSLRVMSALAGVWLLMAGIARIISAFLPGSGSIAHHVLSGMVGVVVLVAGLVCLRDLVNRLAVLSLLFAITWILSGLTEVVLGLQRTGAARLGLLCVGLLSCAAGFVFLLMPDVSLAALVILTGLSSLLVGAAEVALAFVLRGTHTAEATR